MKLRRMVLVLRSYRAARRVNWSRRNALRAALDIYDLYRPLGKKP